MLATIEVTRHQLESGAFPPVCALTGADTSELVTLSLTAMPRRSGALLAAGVVPWLVARAFIARRLQARIPMEPVAARSAARDRSALLVGLLAGIVLTGAGVTVPADGPQLTLAFLGLLIGGGCLVALIWGMRDRRIRAARTAWDSVVLKGVHPRFRDAIAAGVPVATTRPITDLIAEAADRRLRESIDPWA